MEDLDFLEKKNNENFSICSLCKGQCCKRMPGSVHPDQLGKITKEKLLEYYKKGYQFDYWEGDITPESQGLRGYYLRPQTINSKGKIVNPSWGGTCIFLTENGCSMNFDERPLGCQQLEPSEDFNCQIKGGLSKKDYAIAWLPYNSIIEDTIKDFYNPSETDEILDNFSSFLNLLE